jgi:hypothetical protein
MEVTENIVRSWRMQGKKHKGKWLFLPCFVVPYGNSRKTRKWLEEKGYNRLWLCCSKT